jgi:colanic acid/amylovoran biosynthesis glycosyltransferase
MTKQTRTDPAAAPGGARMKLGYVIARFPWPSETFISREVLDLLGIGVDLEIYAFQKPEGADLDLLTPEARGLIARTQYIDKREAGLALASLATPGMLALNGRFGREATEKTNTLLRLGRAAAVIRRARRDGVDGLHAHWPYATQIAALAHAGSGLPYSISVHAHEVAYDNGHFPAAFETLEFSSFCNQAALDFLMKQLPAQARDRSHLIYHGVDTLAFAELPPAGPAAPLRLLSAGRITPTKGFDRLVRACAQARGQGLDVTLTILGRGPGLDDLRALAAELGFADGLELPGWVPHSEVRGYLSRSHAFALLANTDFNDGLPNVVVEAMACGRPVIVSPLPAAQEAIIPGQTGFILDGVEDYAGFCDAVRALLDGEAARRMGEAARRLVVDRYDARAHIRALADLFERTYGRP